MRPQLIRLGSGFVALALLAGAPPAMAVEADVLSPSTANAMAQAASPQAIAEYRRKLKEYQEARAAFEEQAGAYWTSISEKRKGRNAKRRERQAIALDDYVLTQPPVYTGPKRPVSPEPEEEKPPRERKPMPVVADFLKAAADHFQFVPQRPAAEVDFKRAYARYARAAGLTREQAVRVYSFETGGNGNYDMQSGLNPSKPGSRAISTAIGYNQLLTTNSVELLAEQGHEIIKELTARAATLSGAPRKAMDHKLAVLKKMVAFTRTVPDTWSEHQKLANTPQGWAVHAMVLDIDVGPMLQTHKLLTSVHFARAKGHNRPLIGGRTRNDEPDRRRHRPGHGDDAAGDARTGADLEFLPARRLRAQPRRDPPQHRGETAGGHRRAHGFQQQQTRREGTGGGVLVHPPLPSWGV